MLSSWITGIILGMTGSLHCIGMCGPILLSLRKLNPENNTFFEQLNYHIGRTFSYTLIGLLFGIFGLSIGLLRVGQWLSVICGAIIIVYALQHHFNLFSFRINWINSLQSKWIQILTQRMRLIPNFFLGIINGFLPCGMVIVAVALALGMNSITQSTVLMAGFGFGTIPLLLVLGWSQQRIGLNRWRSSKILILIVSLLVGSLLIIRGLNLDIPYLSPLLDEFNILSKVAHCS